ncbi:MAG: hypothetical protein AAFN17_12025 [Pseudomonadota bacterium]
MQAANWLYVHPILRFAATVLGFTGIALGLYIGFRFLETDSGGRLLLAAIGIVQTSVALVLLVLVTVFSTKSLPLVGLRNGSRRFLQRTLPAILRDVRLPNSDVARFLVDPITVTVPEHTSNSATYHLSAQPADSAEKSFCIHIYMNMDKCAVFFYLPFQGAFDLNAAPGGEARIKYVMALVAQRFDYEIKMSERRFGFELEPIAEKEEIDPSTPFLVFCYMRKFSEDFFEKPSEQLAFGQDLGQLVRSFFMTVRRYDLDLATLPELNGKPRDAA